MSLIAIGASDVIGGFGSWRMWWMLAKNDVARRYRRSRLGQFWLTLSMAVMVWGMGLVYSAVFSMPMATYLPHVGAGLVLWGLISTTITDSCNSFTENDNIIRQVALPRFTFILRTLARNIFVLGHNILIIPPLLIVCGTPINGNMLLFFPGLALVLLNLTWIGYILGILSTRFRDIPQIVQSIMQLAFFISPVIYKPEQLSANHLLLLLNPFASMLDVTRQPLLGAVPSLASYVILLTMLIVGWTVALVFAGKYARRVVYWI